MCKCGTTVYAGLDIFDQNIVMNIVIGINLNSGFR